MLTYPFFLSVTDRALYVSGATALVFLLDRCGRCARCEELPGFLGQSALVLYLFHPVLITVLLHSGLRSVPQVWCAACCLGLAISAFLEWVPSSAPSKDAQDVQSSSSSSEGE
mmetsp:Transcript_116643/g.310318  ORF Transcript_116643/g.310318 Transcript_116643/m.310318 type:complete len:113 (+) Transcript_116643:881-1219(+)